MNQSHWVLLGVFCRSRAVAAQRFWIMWSLLLLQAAVTFAVLLLLLLLNIQSECTLQQSILHASDELMSWRCLWCMCIHHKKQANRRKFHVTSSPVLWKVCNSLKCYTNFNSCKVPNNVEGHKTTPKWDCRRGERAFKLKSCVPKLLSPAVSLMAANPFNIIRVGGQCHTRHRIQLLVDTYENGGLERCNL